MYRTLLVLAFIAAALTPSGVHAQGDVVLETLAVKLWPEYDQPSLLVIYDFSVAATATLPVAVTIRIPADATLVAVARNESGGLVNAPYDPPQRQGDWNALTLSIDTVVPYRLEYYVPIAKNGSARHFAYEWPGDYAVNAFDVDVQEPLGATGFKADPALADTRSDQQGLTIHHATLRLARGQAFNLTVDYQKSSDTLSASQLAVQPGDSLDQTASTGISLYSYLPVVLGGLGVVLIIAAGIWYWQLGREPGKRRFARKRAATQADDETGQDSAQIYCHQCGRRAQSSDRFCRTCGARLRREE